MNKKDAIKVALPVFIAIIAIIIGISVYVYNTRQEVKEKIQYYEDKISDSTLSATCICPSVSIPIKPVGTFKYNFNFNVDGTCTLDFSFTPNKNTHANAQNLNFENMQWAVTEDNGEYFIEIKGMYFDGWNSGKLDPILKIRDYDTFFAIGTRGYSDVFFYLAEDE